MRLARPLVALVALVALAWAQGAVAQTILDQEQRLIEIHSLLVALSPLEAPGALATREISVGLELIGVPPIDGTTGNPAKKQITASDRTPVFPRLRLAVGLPAPADFRAFVGIGYIPPVELRQVSSHLGALEAALAYAPGPLAVGLRGHFLAAHSMSPVTDANTRDTLDTVEYGVDLSAGYRLDFEPLGITPYAGVGLCHVKGEFTVFNDGNVLKSSTLNPSLSAGLRLFARQRVEAVAELQVFPGRLVHPSVRLSYVFDWWATR